MPAQHPFTARLLLLVVLLFGMGTLFMSPTAIPEPYHIEFLAMLSALAAYVAAFRGLHPRRPPLPQAPAT